ncbi:ATP-binding protein [Desulfoluna sp.]|uniref:ATP-binding protein n=1 Tax=Desulfoluna sp. TaxID=2045199 RepID=UPI002603248E|nr:ATP-binding protein [Desulfoluna sp.]
MTEKRHLIKDKTLQVKSDLQVLPEIRRFLREMFTDIPEDPVDRMELAANEVAANIIKHAYQGRPDQPISIRATVQPDRICVRFVDRGRTFDPENVPAPHFDGSQEGGFGLFIVSRVVDRFDYLPDEKENQTTLCIHLP